VKAHRRNTYNVLIYNKKFDLSKKNRLTYNYYKNIK
jgi:hypothetical protein